MSQLARILLALVAILAPAAPAGAYTVYVTNQNENTIQAIDGATRPYLDLLTWISPATTCHLPATAAPIGRTTTGLPVGLQIVGPYLEDRTPIAFAAALSDVIGGYASPRR